MIIPACVARVVSVGGIGDVAIGRPLTDRGGAEVEHLGDSLRCDDDVRRFQIAIGMHPLWSADDRSLYSLRPDWHLMVVDYEAKSDVFSPGKARQWSPTPVRNSTSYPAYAPNPDGKRFAVFPVPETAPEEKGSAHVTFLLNFGDELRRWLPAAK